MNFFPFKDTGSLFLKPILIIVALDGEFSIDLVLLKIISGGLFLGSSKIFPSVDVWNKLSSTEYGGAPFLSFGILILFFFAYFIKSVL